MKKKTKLTKKAKRFVINPPQNRLREYRERAGLSLREVSRILDLSIATISRHETADRGLTEQDIKKYSSLFKINSYMLFFKPAESDEPEELEDEQLSA